MNEATNETLRDEREAAAVGGTCGQQTDARDVGARAAAKDGVPARPAPMTMARGGARVKVHNVQGAFSFSQDVVMPTAQIVRDLRDVSDVSRDTGAREASAAPATPAGIRVAAAGSPQASSALDWEISVGGAVNQAFSARLGELARSDVRDAVMSYTCLESPSSGRATANAGTTGIPLAAILERAGGVWEGANVITFTSADGFDVRLPLDYVLGRTSMIAYRLNGAPLKETLGCTNQLWMGGAPAHYFVRDVVRIGVERLAASKVPPSPSAPLAGEACVNHPNIGVLNGLLKGAQKGEIA